MASGQLSKANEPCFTDADCVEEWEFCKVQTTHNSNDEGGNTVEGDTTESVCVHKD